jgi:hypothetical protein
MNYKPLYFKASLRDFEDQLRNLEEGARECRDRGLTKSQCLTALESQINKICKYWPAAHKDVRALLESLFG